ncbi:MAG: zinc ribbon domain-containing protein [Candidatus Aureabacteria bacterium]|nr:zinc ribbon domain-containing protein [Candidatus Auribacterota bacterium]
MEPNPALKICQSCAMPMESPEDFGTNHDGGRNADYCCFCYQSGRFTEPDTTMEAMLERVVSFMIAELSLTEPGARAKMDAIIPKLKRWQLR